jgi:alpha-beta hydrolase superfamily lysophospholipase
VFFFTQLPYILLQGMKDKIVDPNQTFEWHHKTSSEDKTLLTYENGLHELFNEPEKEVRFSMKKASL